MTELVNRIFLKRCVAKICQNVGWTFVQSTPLELLTDLLQDYITSVAKTAYKYAIHCGNTEANINHLALAFKDMGISVEDLKEYVSFMDSSSLYDVPQYPVSKENHLNFLKPGSREVVTRSVHIHEHLPPMHPHLEDQELSLKNSPLHMESTSATSTPVGSPKSKLFKRPGDPLMDGPAGKRARYFNEEDIRPLRELSSVVMTTSGFLSHAREGKLPEARVSVRVDACSNDKADPLVTTDPKSDKRKKYKLVDMKKEEKEAHNINDHSGNESITVRDEEKSKKQPAIETWKPVKPNWPAAGVVKNSPNHSNNKILKPIPKKISTNTNSPIAPYGVPSVIKKIPKIDKSSPHPPVKDPGQFTTGSEYKLPSEPDKQKLNFFKKISKIKDEGDAPEKTELSKEIVLQIDLTIDSVIKREMAEIENSSPVISKAVVKEPKPIPDLSIRSIPKPEISKKADQILHSPFVSSKPAINRIVENATISSSNSPDKAEHMNSEVISTSKTHLKVHNEVPSESPQPNLSNSISQPAVQNIFQTSKAEKKRKEKSKPTKEWNHVHKKELEHSAAVNNTIKNVVPVSSFLPPVSSSLSAAMDVCESDPVVPSPLPTAPGLVPSTTSLVPSILGGITKSDPFSLVSLKADPKPPVDSKKADSTVLPSTSEAAKSTDPAGLKKKEHKKDKKDKVKKKKKNKLKAKDKSEKKKSKLEKREKLKDKLKIKKEKKEKKKEKEADEPANSSPITSSDTSAVPKITLKLGPASPVENSSDSPTRKIIIKPIVQKDPVPPLPPPPPPKVERDPSPEIARFSPILQSPKTAKITKPASPIPEKPKETPPPETSKPADPARKPGIFVDRYGNEFWMCPACHRFDDGSAMIGCDGCDAWYHWECVGITVAPEDIDWYCTICLNKKKAAEVGEKKIGSEKKKKKNKKGKGKDGEHANRPPQL